MNHTSLRGWRRDAALVSLVGALLAISSSHAANNQGNSGSSVVYSGQATALRIDEVEQPVSGSIILADTGPLPATGGLIQKSESNFKMTAPNPFPPPDEVTALSVDLAYAVTEGADSAASSGTTLNGFHAMIRTTVDRVVVIDAEYVAGSATASLSPNGQGNVQGSVTVQGLKIDGVAVNVSGEVNQVVWFAGGKLVINQRVSSTGSGHADIVIVPLQFFVDDCMNGAIGKVSCGVSGGKQPPAPRDCGKLTGGGWIVGPSGAKCSFGVSGGIRRGEFWGHLNYIDHGTGMQVKSTAVTNFHPNPNVPDCRVIYYNVTINGVAGTAVVDAWDRGEPGRNDFFSIRLSNGYTARGTLGGDSKGGGNLQLHKCPPGWE